MSLPTFEQRRRAIRHHRASTSFSGVTRMAVWVAGFGGLMFVLLGGVFSLR